MRGLISAKFGMVTPFLKEYKYILQENDIGTSCRRPMKISYRRFSSLIKVLEHMKSICK